MDILNKPIFRGAWTLLLLGVAIACLTAEVAHKGSFADWNTHVNCDKQPGN